MSAGSAAAPSREATRTALDRFLAVVPYAVAAVVLLAILLWEAGTRDGPTTFSDELQWAQISRSIAHTGHGALLGQHVGFRSLYAFLIAPAWWLSTTTAAYTAIKYLNEIVMAAAAIPVYFLGRQLVSRRAALVAALATLCTSAYFYGPQLLPEVLAFPTFALCAYVSVRALAGDGRRWSLAAVVLSLIAIEVRGELAMALPALVLAAAWLWVVGPRGQRFRRGWSVLDHAGAVVLLIGVFIVGNRAIGNHSHEWSYTTQAFKGRIWHLGLESASALAIGLGLLPVMAGLASLWLPERRHDPRWRAFAAYFAASILMFGTYTAVKAAYLSTNFATLVEERNLIYLQPLLLVGAVVYFSARRPSLRPAIPAIAFTAFLALYYGYQLGFPYGEAPGYGIATMANRAFRWTQTDIRWALVVVAAVSAALVLLPFRRLAPPTLRAVLAVAAVATAAWMLAAQITSARGANAQAKTYAAGLPSSQAGYPVNWLDRLDDNQGVTYLGQKEPNDPLGLWLLEFWNASLKHVYTIDGTAPGPGPTVTPDLLRPDGTLTSDPGLPYVLQDNGVQMIGKPVVSLGALTLVRLPSHPWRLREAVYNVTNDGWITPPLHAETDTTAEGSWAYFGSGHGTLEIVVSRKGFNAPSLPPARATVRVGPVALNEQRAPVVRNPTAVKHLVVQNGTSKTLSLHVRPPVAVQVSETPTFKPTDYGGTDQRTLGAQVGFKFTPDR
jgi:hypothetical protein